MARRLLSDRDRVYGDEVAYNGAERRTPLRRLMCLWARKIFVLQAAHSHLRDWAPNFLASQQSSDRPNFFIRSGSSRRRLVSTSSHDIPE
jgi:hypothetical protein